jgi:hypothetical protein
LATAERHAQLDEFPWYVYLLLEVLSWSCEHRKQVTQLTEEKRTLQYSPEAGIWSLMGPLCTALVQGYLWPSKKFVVDTAVSNVETGCVISLVRDGQEHVVIYRLMILSKAETIYLVTGRYLEAILNTLKHFC